MIASYSVIAECIAADVVAITRRDAIFDEEAPCGRRPHIISSCHVQPRTRCPDTTGAADELLAPDWSDVSWGVDCAVLDNESVSFAEACDAMTIAHFSDVPILLWAVWAYHLYELSSRRAGSIVGACMSYGDPKII